MIVLLHFCFKELRESLLQHQTHVVMLCHAEKDEYSYYSTLTEQSVFTKDAGHQFLSMTTELCKTKNCLEIDFCFI